MDVVADERSGSLLHAPNMHNGAVERQAAKSLAIRADPLSSVPVRASQKSK
jgi:hypothetical protein